MIKIRALGTKELRQVLNLLEGCSREGSADQEFEYTVLENFRQLYVPMHLTSQMLPPHYQFVPAIYVAVSDGRVLGLIWLSRDGQGNSRWKIDQLIVDPDMAAFDVGNQLINFVVNRYGADGVKTFLALVDYRYEQALALLKSCGFRHCTRSHDYVLESPEPPSPEKAQSIQGLREGHSGDLKQLSALHSDCMPPEVRLSLEKSPKDFSRPVSRAVSDRLKGIFFKRWVLEDSSREGLLAAVDIYTHNYKDYHIRLMVSPGWMHLYENLLSFCIAQVMKNTGKPTLYTQVYEFAKEEMAQLEAFGFKRANSAEVLVKDYWIPLQDQVLKPTSPILLIAGKISPACSR